MTGSDEKTIGSRTYTDKQWEKVAKELRRLPLCNEQELIRARTLFCRWAATCHVGLSVMPVTRFHKELAANWASVLDALVVCNKAIAALPPAHQSALGGSNDANQVPAEIVPERLLLQAQRSLDFYTIISDRRTPPINQCKAVQQYYRSLARYWVELGGIPSRGAYLHGDRYVENSPFIRFLRAASEPVLRDHALAASSMAKHVTWAKKLAATTMCNASTKKKKATHGTEVARPAHTAHVVHESGEQYGKAKNGKASRRTKRGSS
jgi:hypothetical protein